MTRGPSRAWPFLFFLVLLLCSGRAAGLEGIVERVYDGDTLLVAGAGKVRLLGIDTPEPQTSDRDRWLRSQGVNEHRLRQIALQAHRFVADEVGGKQVRLEFDGPRRDRHGRLLAHVRLPDGRLLNRVLIERGFAAVYRRFDFDRKEEFLAAEAEARQRRAGLWADAGQPSPVGPDGR